MQDLIIAKWSSETTTAQHNNCGLHYRAGPYSSPLETCPPKNLTLIFDGWDELPKMTDQDIHLCLTQELPSYTLTGYYLLVGIPMEFKQCISNRKINHNQIGQKAHLWFEQNAHWLH